MINKNKLPINSEKFRKSLKKIVWIFIKNPLLMFFLIFVFSFLLGGIVFYQYIFLSTQKDFKSDQVAIELDGKPYERILKRWDEKEERIGIINEEKYKDIFSIISKQNNKIFEEESEQELEEESKEESEEGSEEKSEEEIFLPEELESLLTKTLFQFYEIKRDTMPLISERALIWEKLGLGEAEDYEGSYSQNATMLETLKKELSN